MFRNVSILLMISSAEVLSAELPADLVAVKQQILTIAAANTTRTNNIPAIRSQLDPLVSQLSDWFAANRPANEVQLTQVPWKSVWYDDPDIQFDFEFGPFAVTQDRNQIYQVIENGFYYNVSETRFRVGSRSTILQGFLKGEYQIIRPATVANAGQPRLNTVDLEFAANRLRVGPLPRDITLKSLVQRVESRRYLTLPTPGPIGITGELWNEYVDADLRIAAGFDDRKPDVIDLYILRKVSKVID